MKAMKLALVFVVLPLILGCNGSGLIGPKDDVVQNDALEIAPELRYSDIPVPRGFVYLPDDSWTYEGQGPVRLADLRYKGKSSLQATVDFFLEQMPISGWQKEMVVGMETKKRLRFTNTKKSDSCEILIEKKMGTMLIQIRIN